MTRNRWSPGVQGWFRPKVDSTMDYIEGSLWPDLKGEAYLGETMPRGRQASEKLCWWQRRPEDHAKREKYLKGLLQLHKADSQNASYI